MNRHRTAMQLMASKKWIFRLTAIVLGSLVMMGCDVSRSWKEEVKLSDGSVIVVKRRMVRERFGEIGHHGRVLKQELEYDKAGGAIHWVGDIDPVIFDFAQGKAYVVAFPQVYAECQRYGFPNPPFVFFRELGPNWERVDAGKVPKGLEFNLLRNGWDAGGGLITFSLKRAQDVSPPAWFKKFNKDLNMACAAGYSGPFPQFPPNNSK